MKLLKSLIILVSFLTTISCSKDSDEKMVSFSFIGKEWTTEKNNIDAVLYENVLEIWVLTSNEAGINSSLKLVIHNPSIGTFNISQNSKHAFQYFHSSFGKDFASLTRFQGKDQSLVLTITKLDKTNHLISFTFDGVLSSIDLSDQILNVSVNDVSIQKVNFAASYAKYFIEDEYFHFDEFNYAIDTLNDVKDLTYYQAAGYSGLVLQCWSYNDIVRGDYELLDTTVHFSAAQGFLLNQKMKDYILKVAKAENGNIQGSFNANVIYEFSPDDPGTSMQHGYFDLYRPE